LKITWTGQFKKDYKRISRQQKDIKALRSIIETLSKGERLNPKHRDHKLSGQWVEHRECHIGPNWLLIYRIDRSELILERMGSHADLFE
jgi:mRNA interferase YafQ